MKLTAILLSLLVYFHGAYAQDNFMSPPIPARLGGWLIMHPMMCGLYVSEDEDDRRAAAAFPQPFPSICARYNSSGQIKGYLGGWGKWCVTTAMQSEATILTGCGFPCDDMNLTNTSLELPMSVDQRLTDLSSDGQANAEATLTILDEWLVDELSMGEDEDGVMMEFIERFRLSVHACRLHECEDVAQCQRVADMAFEEILESGIELDIDMDAFDNLEDARQLALLLGSPP